MKYYLAPMEGITGYVFRNVWTEIFGGADRCFTPFLSPNQNKSFQTRERSDVVPEHNTNTEVSPQILANRADYFLWAAQELEQMGYAEVNLNLGCPSGTVTAKKKGAGLLAYPEEIDRLLEEIFNGTSLRVSVKTRLGKENTAEFFTLLPVFNRYPLSELIIHPRVQKDFYRGTPDLDVFGWALEESTNPVCYNGDIFTVETEAALRARFPGLERIMCGRGVIADPALLRKLTGGLAASRKERKCFHDRLYAEYRSILPGERPVLFKMKEVWSYWYGFLPDPEAGKRLLRRAGTCRDYELAADVLLREILPEGNGCIYAAK